MSTEAELTPADAADDALAEKGTPATAARAAPAAPPARAATRRVTEDEEDAGAEESNDPTAILCKFSCGKPVQPGLTRKGNPFDTCCRTCALNKGIGCHDGTCGGKKPAARQRNACPKGAKCRERTPAHLSALAHPLNEDYAIACSVTKGVEAEPLSLKVLFDWTDADGSGKLSREELEGSLGEIRQVCGFLPAITEEAWHHLDEDGNGVVNFSEFASWAGPRLGLPLGVAKLMARSASMTNSPCSVIGCPCEAFEGAASGKDSDRCKLCHHKRGLHVVAASHAGEIPFPPYWDNQSGKFTTMVDMGASGVYEMQQVVSKTYLNKSTKDRKIHNPTCPMVPESFTVRRVYRNENSSSWEEYAFRRAEIQDRVRESGDSIVKYDTRCATAFKEVGGAKADRLVHDVNEWYLFHGTNPAAAKAICGSDFKVSRAGSNTGTLYGKGLYFAESITKADEYAKPGESGNYAVLLCRIIGGQVRYTAEVTPDPEDLVSSCISGPYDSVLGDREACRGTYREFVLFDSEDVYVEYVIEYTRNYKEK